MYLKQVLNSNQSELGLIQAELFGPRKHSDWFLIDLHERCSKGFSDWFGNRFWNSSDLVGLNSNPSHSEISFEIVLNQSEKSYQSCSMQFGLKSVGDFNRNVSEASFKSESICTNDVRKDFQIFSVRDFGIALIWSDWIPIRAIPKSLSKSFWTNLKKGCNLVRCNSV